MTNVIMKHPVYLLMLLLLFPGRGVEAAAQCRMTNTAFKSGEHLSYNLYFNWKFVWVKVGTASMYVADSRYDGHPAYKSGLTTRGNKKADKMFVLRDTLLCYTTKDLVPLYYRKGAEEGKRYRVDEIRYSYSGGKCRVSQSRRHTDGRIDKRRFASDECVYDMMSIFLRARSFNTEGWKAGHTVRFPIADGDGTNPAMLKYRGKKKIKADNGVKYRCLELSYVETDKGKNKEIARFFVTDDTNHIPVRLDMFLKFGSAKAFLTSMKGLKNRVAAQDTQ